MKRFAVLLFAATFPFGCGGDDEADPLAQVDGFCQEWGIRACNDSVVQDCSASTQDDCILAQRDFCLDLVPTGKYTKNGAKECLDAVEDAYSDAQLDGEERRTVLYLEGECISILSGASGPGDGCDTTGDCSTEAGLTCVIQAGEESGTCQEAEMIGGGFACGEPNQVCETAFYCNGSNCVARPGDGDTCTPSIPCAADFRCERPDGTAPGADDTDATCVPRLALRAECSEDDECQTGICAGATATSTGVCANSIPLSPIDPICDDLS